MKNPVRLLVLLAALLSFLCLAPAWAGPESQFYARGETKTADDKTPLDLFTIESGYVFESDLNHGGSLGEQDEFHNAFEYGHRFLLNGNLYLHLGLAYNRFDFGRTNAPVPIHLQSGAAVIGLDYMRGSDLGAFIQFRPGFYTEEHLGLSSFDAPVTLGRIFILQEDKLYLFLGANAGLLRGGFPVLPLVGLVYRPSDQWSFDAILPEPRITYYPSKNLGLWLGGELIGGSFRTDHHDDITPKKLSGTQVDYTDYQAGLGIAYIPCHDVTIDLGGGVAIQRDFKFHRAGENYRTDPAPYFRVEIKAAF